MPTAACPPKIGTTWAANCVVAGASIAVGDTLSGNNQISGGLSIKGGTVTLSSGTFWITDGNLTLGPGGGGSGLQCAACTVIMTTANPAIHVVGAVILNSLANLTLNAPTSVTNPFNNLVLIQDSNGLPAGTTMPPQPSTVWANATETLNGLIYFPDSELHWQGGPSTGSCQLIVANKLTLHGNPTVNVSGCPTTGPGAKKTVSTVALVE
jgi:hypothetical protein